MGAEISTIDGLSTSGAARLLGVSESYIRKLASSGVLPFVSTPIGKVYDRAGVREYGEKRRQVAGSAAEPCTTGESS